MCVNLLTSTVAPSVHYPFSNLLHELYTMWTLLSFGKINIEYPVIQVAFKYSHNRFYTKLSTSSRRTLVVTTARIQSLLCNPYWAHHCTNSCTAFVTKWQRGWDEFPCMIFHNLAWIHPDTTQYAVRKKTPSTASSCVFTFSRFHTPRPRPLRAINQLWCKEFTNWTLVILRCNYDWGTRLRFRHWLLVGISPRNELLAVFSGVSPVFCHYSWGVYPTQLSWIWHWMQLL